MYVLISVLRHLHYYYSCSLAFFKCLSVQITFKGVLNWHLYLISGHILFSFRHQDMASCYFFFFFSTAPDYIAIFIEFKSILIYSVIELKITIPPNSQYVNPLV